MLFAASSQATRDGNASENACPALPRGVSGRGPGSGAVGPFPYTAGLFWGVSYELVRWMA